MPLPFTLEQKETALWMAIIAGLVLLLVSLGPVLTPFIAASILAYALNPGVDWLTSWRIGKFGFPRALAVGIMMLLLFAAVLALALVVLPLLKKETLLLQEQIPNMLDKLNTLLGPKLQELG
ncbi:MAG: AI-2E family transporter, partial [Burkholderiales bacterium]